MISKLKEKFSNTNKLTKVLFKYGFISFYVILVLGMCMLFSSNTYQDTYIAQEIISSSLAVLCEFIISAIFFDFLNNSGK